jgi:hypothetical protein
MAGACISREKAYSEWLGRVLLEKKLNLDGWGACFSRKGLALVGGVDFWSKSLVLMAGARAFREKA